MGLLWRELGKGSEAGSPGLFFYAAACRNDFLHSLAQYVSAYMNKKELYVTFMRMGYISVFLKRILTF